MWKPEHLTSAEWAIVEPMIPPAKHGGRKRTIDVREILNGIFYVLWTGCQWQALPKDLPPKSTVWAYFLRCWLICFGAGFDLSMRSQPAGRGTVRQTKDSLAACRQNTAGA